MFNYRVKQKVHKDPYTYVKLEANFNIGNRTIVIEGEGFTKRNSCDAPNKKIGLEVAETRAKDDLRKKREKIKTALRKKQLT